MMLYGYRQAHQISLEYCAIGGKKHDCGPNDKRDPNN